MARSRVVSQSPGSRNDNGVRCAPRLLFFHHDRYRPVRRQAHLLSFDIRDQHQIDKVMVALVTSFTAVGLGESDPALLNAIDSSDMNAVGSNHFHMALYLATVAHFISASS